MKAFLFLLTLLAASPAFAEVWSGKCHFSANLTVATGADKFDIAKKERGCYRFVDTDSTSTSDLISVTADSALWCFDPDNTDAVADTARVVIHYCPHGGTPGGTGSANTCISLGGANGNASLDGTEGTSSSQNACVRTGPGIFYVEVTAACAKTSTNYCQVTVQGEEAAP
jgi:hypothetical protein